MKLNQLLKRAGKAALFRVKPYILRSRIKLVQISRYVSRDKSGVNLIGYFSYTFGVAEVGRFFAQHVRKAGVPLQIYDLHSPVHKKVDDLALQAYQPYFTTSPSFHKNVFFINADQIAFVKSKMPELFAGRYNTAVFFWEFNDYFDFPEAFKVIDEVIAFTEFIATAVRKFAPPRVKVTSMPFPFIKNWEITMTKVQVRNHFNIPGEAFLFIFNFDFHSVYTRKNPEAVLKAFEMAFSTTDKVCLIFKTIHAEADSANHLSFQAALAKMALEEKVILIDENLDRNHFMNLLNASDCYISLHRSEGLGLGMLEAMSMGKPVIGTNFGGNTDFMNDNNSLPVSYRLVPVIAGNEPYKEGWLWADADIEEAAGYMQKLYRDEDYAKELGLRAQQSVQDQYNNDVFQNALKSWMNS